MKIRNKRRAAKRINASTKPIVIHINGLYIETSPNIGSLLDFCRMIANTVKEPSK